MFWSSEVRDGVLGVCIRYSIDLHGDEFAIFPARKFTQRLSRGVIGAPHSSDNGGVGLMKKPSGEGSAET